MIIFFEEKVGDKTIGKELRIDCDMSRVKKITAL
jgi:hypothetical protein